MSIKQLRQKKNLSQEKLAETVGLSLRTIQRAESGENIAYSSWAAMADYFCVNVNSLKNHHTMPDSNSVSTALTSNLANHRAIQLVIFVVTFFVCITQWMAYYAYLNPPTGSTSLGGILIYLSQIAVGAAIFACLFNRARVLFIWSYYFITCAFVLCAIGIGYWTEPYVETAAYELLFPVFYTLMLCTLLIFHVLQTALSLKSETLVISKQHSSFMRQIETS